MRLFVALDLPQEVKVRLAAMAGGIPGVRWVPPENYHLTLRFIGEVPGHMAEEVDLALAHIRAKPFELSLAGLGTFEKGGRVQSLHVVAERTPGLAHLQAKIETALQRAGLPPERKKFAPHVTIARTDGAALPKLAGFVQAHNLFRTEPLTVEHFVLFSSRLGKEQAVYTPEVEYALAA
ncbi:RNA 2',3'-cyclic phosphodiesterase [Roseococcus pinisoli]|uniref:RNA 2',3'-cyclic phosphodiesterase n=1 Tax=Roseococcus pinisoli TaxID=2835040 RepID=A0ABS5QC46_9PROT|nr:RNA 2',3'-cyclic phosphodiesterase [Roseococcus pinisoli]MBS7811260.1 RNA 2',3'-cyclic phosphodiesterase [Roseococcus pinisoli]